MTDTKIKNGDIAVDNSGNFIRLDNTSAMFQRALICASARLGNFAYDRNLGSHIEQIDFKSENASKRLELVINEALVSFENTSAKVLEFSADTIKIEIRINNETRIEEVHLYGNL